MSDQVPSERDTKFDFSASGLTGFLRSINADTTPDQTIEGRTVPGMNTTILIDNPGGGVTQLDVRALFASVATPALAAVPVPNDTPTVVLTLSVPGPGLWFFTGNVNTTGAVPPAGTVNVRTYLLNGASQIGESTQQMSPAGVIVDFSASVISILLNLAGGEIISLNCDQHNGAAFGISLNAVLNGIRLGS